MKDLSPAAIARIGGGLYLVNIVAGAYAVGFVAGALVVPGHAATTAHNIASNELLFRTGLAAHVVVTATNVPLALVFYELFKVVDRRLAALVVLFTVVATAIETVGVLFQLAALGNLDDLGTIALALNAQAAAYDLSTVFFGFNALALGYLVAASTFLPRAIGVLLVVDGLAYLVYAFSDFVAPGFAAHLVPWFQLLILAGEGSLTLWLLFGGLRVARWRQLEVAV